MRSAVVLALALTIVALILPVLVAVILKRELRLSWYLSVLAAMVWIDAGMITTADESEMAFLFLFTIAVVVAVMLSFDQLARRFT